MVSCDVILEKLRTQLAQSFAILPSTSEAASGCWVQTPFTYPDNRVLTVYVSPTSTGEIELSDDGYAHAYARISGVSRDVIDRTSAEFEERYHVAAGNGEVVATAVADSMMSALIAVIESSQAIAETVEKRVVHERSNRLNRQIERTLVFHDRIYERRGKFPYPVRDIDVDYNVLPSDRYSQLNLFSLNHKITIRNAESIAYRVRAIQEADPAPGFTNRVLVISDESSYFGEGRETWQNARDTIRGTGARILPITNSAAIAAELAA